MAAWQAWSQLSDAQLDEIAKEFLASIEPELRQALAETLDSATPREVREIEVVIETNLGEFRRFVSTPLREQLSSLMILMLRMH